MPKCTECGGRISFSDRPHLALMRVALSHVVLLESAAIAVDEVTAAYEASEIYGDRGKRKESRPLLEAIRALAAEGRSIAAALHLAAHGEPRSSGTPFGEWQPRVLSLLGDIRGQLAQDPMAIGPMLKLDEAIRHAAQ